MKRQFKYLFLTLLLGVLLLPASAMAADNIFQVISQKMMTTVIDVRRIVYVIAGFGLIMFTTLAIFNKISFKHLAYIMIGLSLLAVMMPFINYFAGVNLEDTEFSYGNYLNGGSAIVGSDIPNQDGGGKNCGKDCPDGNPDQDPNSEMEKEFDKTPGGNGNNNGSGSGGNGTGGNGGGNGVGTQSGGLNLPVIPRITGGAEGANGGGIIPPTSTSGNAPTVTEWDSNGCRYNNGARQCCSGKIQNGVCQKNPAQVMADILRIANAGIAGANQALNAVEYAKLLQKAVENGAVRIGDIISGDGKALDKLGALAASVGMSADQIYTSSGQLNGDFQNFLANLGYVIDGVTGTDAGSSGIANSGVGAAVDTGTGIIKGGADSAGGAAKVGSEIYQTGKRGEALGDRIDDFFGN